MKKAHYRRPTKYDAAPYMSIWVHSHESAGNILYIQVSTDKLIADWQRLGDILEKAFEPYVDQEAFLTECLRLFSKPSSKSLRYVQLMIEKL